MWTRQKSARMWALPFPGMEYPIVPMPPVVKNLPFFTIWRLFNMENVEDAIGEFLSGEESILLECVIDPMDLV